jgi:hypothetical protein
LNGILGLVGSPMEYRAVLYQRAELAMSLRGHVEPLSSPIAAMRAGFNASSLSVFRLTLAHRQIVDPTRWPTGLHDNKFGAAVFENRIEMLTCGRAGHEFGFARI